MEANEWVGRWPGLGVGVLMAWGLAGHVFTAMLTPSLGLMSQLDLTLSDRGEAGGALQV
jgi:hypothetical protein